MNTVIFDKSCIAVFTNIIEADPQKHDMMQLFFSFHDPLILNITDKILPCKCVVINSGIEHSFYSNNEIYFSVLIDPHSWLGTQLNDNYLNMKPYYIFNGINFEVVDRYARDRNLEQLDEQLYKEIFDSLLEKIAIEHKLQTDHHFLLEEIFRLTNETIFPERLLGKLADYAQLSEQEIIELFYQLAGISWNHFIALQKVQKDCLAYFKDRNVGQTDTYEKSDRPLHFAYKLKEMTGLTAANLDQNCNFIKTFSF